MPKTGTSLTPWPCHPNNLTERISKDLVTLVIAGMCERLNRPVAIMEPCGPGDRDTGASACCDFSPLYPAPRPSTRYSDFCLLLNKIPQAEKE